MKCRVPELAPNYKGKPFNVERYAGFSDDELYMLKRSVFEGSFDVVCGKDANNQPIYDEEQRSIHMFLYNELIHVLKTRDSTSS